jgi:hypothetical protein
MCLFVCLMSELVNSRCKDCSPKTYQCTPCSKLDVTVRKQMKIKKDQEKKKLGSVCLFPLQQYPPMPPAAPLSINGQVMHPPPIASPNMFDGHVMHPPPIASPNLFAADVSPKASPVVARPSPSPSTIAASSDLRTPEPAANVSPKASQCFARPSNVFINPSLLSPQKAAIKPALVAAACVVLSSTTKKRSRDGSDLSDCESDCSSSNGSAMTLSGECLKMNANAKPAKMSRITKEERFAVCDWIVKERSDGKMLNGRWIRNGGAKGATMTATSSEVKTSGAYEALALYVNRRCRGVSKSIVWTKDVSRKRWAAMLDKLLFLFL